MQIQVNTDNNITGREDVVRLVHSSIEGAVGRFGKTARGLPGGFSKPPYSPANCTRHYFS